MPAATLPPQTRSGYVAERPATAAPAGFDVSFQEVKEFLVLIGFEVWERVEYV